VEKLSGRLGQPQAAFPVPKSSGTTTSFQTHSDHIPTKMDKFVTEAEVLKLINQALSKKKMSSISKGAAEGAEGAEGAKGAAEGGEAAASCPAPARVPAKKMSYDDFFKQTDEDDLLTRVFRAQVPVPVEHYPNGLAGVSNEDLATYFTYVVRSLVLCGFVHSYSAWMYMLVMNARKDTVFGHRNLELHQLKNLVTLLAVPLVDASGRKSMAERVNMTLGQRTTYDLVCELAVRVGNGEVLAYTGAPIVQEAKAPRNKKSGVDGPPATKKAKKTTTSGPAAAAGGADKDEGEGEGEDDDEDDDVFDASPSRRSGRMRTPTKTFFAGEEVVGAEAVDEAVAEAVDEAEAAEATEAEADEAEADEAEDDDSLTQPQPSTQVVVGGPQLQFLSPPPPPPSTEEDAAAVAAEPARVYDDDVPPPPPTPPHVDNIEAADPIEFTPAATAVADLSFEKVTIPMVPRPGSDVQVSTAAASLVKKLVIKRPGAPVAPAAPVVATTTEQPAAVDGGVRMNPEGTGYHSDGVFYYIWEPVDVNRHMTVMTRAGSWTPFFNWRSAYEKDPRPENRYVEYHRRDGTTGSLEGYVRRFFEVWPMPGLDLMDVDALTPTEVDVMVKQHMRGLLKKKTLGELRDAL
jgi:hypothetical protein